MHILAVNNSETLFCIGSSSGLINIYDESCQNPDVDGHLSPIKTLKNLRAPITLQRFNRCDEIALFGSELVAGQTKLYHANSHRNQIIKKLNNEIWFLITQSGKVSSSFILDGLLVLF